MAATPQYTLWVNRLKPQGSRKCITVQQSYSVTKLNKNLLAVKYYFFEKSKMYVIIKIYWPAQVHEPLAGKHNFRKRTMW